MKILFLFIFIFSIQCKAQSLNDTTCFQTFWSQFREAVINNDTSKIISFTKLPIRTRGPQDSDPYIKYGRNEFVAVFTKFLERTTGTNINDENERQIDLIRKTEILEPGIIEYHRIGDMEFEILNGKWKLVMIYYWVIK